MINQVDASDADKGQKRMRHMLGPQAVDHSVRQAIQFCWMSLPEGKRNPDAVGAEVRRIVERALNDLREDAQAFGIGQETE